MTGKELIDFIHRHGLENHPVEIQYRDDGGYYYGTDDPEPEAIEAGQPRKYAGCADYKRLIL